MKKIYINPVVVLHTVSAKESLCLISPDVDNEGSGGEGDAKSRGDDITVWEEF